MIYLISGFFSFLLVILITPIFIKHFTAVGLLDKPDNYRKVHSDPVPRMGGLVIFLVLILFIFLFYPNIIELKDLLIGSVILAILGIVDDIKGVRWPVKFVVQAIASVFMLKHLLDYGGINFNIAGYNLPVEVAIPISFLAIIGLINAFNLLDGLDGLVSGISLIISSLSFILSFQCDNFLVSLVSVVMIGSTLGFLKYNGNPARIFLGDTGALLLGYFSIWLIFLTTAKSGTDNNVDLIFIFIVFSLPIIDTLRVMIARIIDKRNPFLPDNNHIHHIIYSKKIRHKTTVLLILILVSFTGLIGLVYEFYSKEYGIIIFALFSPFITFTGDIIEVVIRKENLLYYGRLIKKTPSFLINFYRNYLLPVIAFGLVSFFIYLIFQKAIHNDMRYIYLLIFSIITFTYSLVNLDSKNYFSDILVFLNFLLFFYITGFNGLFYHLYELPVIGPINLNQTLTILLIPTIGFFVLFRERILENFRIQTFSGTDLILGALIISIFLFIQASSQKAEYYRYGDILLRSYLVYILYKILTHRYQRFHFHLYLSTYIIVIVTLLRTVIF